ANRAARLSIILDHVEGGRAFRRAVGLGHPRIDDEPVAVLRHQMSHVTELGFLAGPLAEQPGIRVGGRGMRVVLAPFAMEVALGIAPAATTLTFARRRVSAVLRHKALHARPCFDQRAVDHTVHRAGRGGYPWARGPGVRLCCRRASPYVSMA